MSAVTGTLCGAGCGCQCGIDEIIEPAAAVAADRADSPRLAPRNRSWRAYEKRQRGSRCKLYQADQVTTR